MKRIQVVVGLVVFAYSSVLCSAEETLYFADTTGPRVSRLATVTFNGDCVGQITPLPVGAGDGFVPYDNVIALAAEPDGDGLYFLDAGLTPARLVRVDLSDWSLTEVGDVVPDVGLAFLFNVEQAAYSPEGVLYISSSGQDRIYTLDTDTAMATCVGQPTWEQDGSLIDIEGADLAFASDGTLYMYTNMPGDTAPKGLYRLSLPAAGCDDVTGTWLGAGDPGGLVTGMVIQDEGLGDILVSVTITPGADEFVLMDRSTGAELDRYPMKDEACRDFSHAFGDMSNSTVTPPECFLVIGDGPGNATFLKLSHLFQTQIDQVQDFHPVLMEDIPEFVLPGPGMTTASTGSAAAGGSSTGPLSGQTDVPEWMWDGEFSLQILMWNPDVFPQLPEQTSYGLRVRVTSDGTVVSRPYGSGTGIEVWPETSVNDQGQAVVRFPFAIPGI